MRKQCIEWLAGTKKWKIFQRALGLALMTLFIGAIPAWSKSEKTGEAGVQNVQQQPHVLTGIVRDKGGEPLPGVSVSVKGTGKGGSTDSDGKYSIQVNSGETVTFSYLGYQTTNKVVDASTKTFDLVMLEDAQMIDEIVVVGFGSQKKVNLTGAVSNVNMDKALGNRPITSVQAALQGAVPGLQVVNTSGKPGSSYNMTIRGVSTVSPNPNQPRDSSPLILLDNVPVDLSMINPEDIESVSVLKDAASTAIYGARAAFGVVLVTSKKGAKNQKAHFTYSNNFAFRNPAELPQKVTPMQHVQFLKDAGCVNFIAAGQDMDTWLNYLKEYETNPSKYPSGYVIGNNNVRYDLKPYDMYNDMMETGIQQTHNLSVTGGSSDITYRMSFGYDDEDGVLIRDKDSYKRYNVTGFISSDVTSWMTAQLESSYATSSALDPYSLSFNGVSFWSSAANLAPYTPLDGMESNGRYYLFTTSKNIMDMTTNPATTKLYNTRIFGKLILKPFKGMTVTGEYTYNSKTIKNENPVPIVEMFDPQKYELATNKNQSNPSSSFSKQDEMQYRNTLNIYATYNFDFNKAHNFTVMGGFNQESYSMDMVWAKNTEMINDLNPSITGGTGTVTAGDNYDESAVRGLFYRFNYDYKGRYLFEANGRYDGSSKFPESQRFGFFPSFSGAWRISEEAFMESSRNILSNLKLRASWGNIGNQNIPSYEYLSKMAAYLGSWSTDGISRTRYLDTPQEPGIYTWETVQTLDFGLDFGLLNNRLNSSLDWYVRDTKGMLGPESYPLTIGIPTAKLPYANSSDMQSKGWEFQIAWNDKIDHVTYGIAFNIGDVQSEITRYNNPTKLLSQPYYTGMKIGEIWGYAYDRLYTIDDFVAGTVDPNTLIGNGSVKPGIGKLKGTNPNPGDVLYKYADKDGLIWEGDNTADNPGSRRVVGNSTRRYEYGINLNAGWKGFDLSVFMQGVGKRDLPWRNDALVFPFGSYAVDSRWRTMYTHQLDYWTPEHQNAEYPRYYYNSNGIDNFGRVTDKFLLNGAYLRLKNVTVSYSFPKEMIKKWQLTNLKLFFSGENLYTWDKLPQGIDPDNTPQSGGVNYPLMRAFSFGINVGI